MQPTYLPWLGYFDLLDQAAHVVLLDSVQFSYQSWQHRNRVRTHDGLSWLTVPVLHKGRSGQHIADVEIAPAGKFPQVHERTLRQSYGGSPAFDWLADDLLSVLDRYAPPARLADLNVALIELLGSRLGLAGEFVRSSELGCVGRRSELLVDICRRLEADTYLSPRGAAQYLVEDAALFEDAGIAVQVQTYDHPTYPQRYQPFIPFASAVDALFNVGEAAGRLMRSGRRNPISLSHLHFPESEEAR